MSEEPKAPVIDPLRRGRRVAIGVFYAIVVTFTMSLAGQVTWQVLAPRFATYAPTSCKDGLRALAASVESARAASEGAEESPEVALAQFRAGLSPAWDEHNRIAASCRTTNDQALLSALDVIEELRYAEESVIRRDARDLSPLRRKVRALTRGLLAAGP